MCILLTPSLSNSLNGFKFIDLHHLDPEVGFSEYGIGYENGRIRRDYRTTQSLSKYCLCLIRGLMRHGL